MTRSRLTALVLALAAFAALPAMAWAADPFYTNRMREAIVLAERGDHQEAARLYRIACFGFLEEGDLLSECLVRLALSQAAAGEDDAFGDTFRRLTEAEQLLGIYSDSNLSPDLREAFEVAAIQRVPDSELAGTPAFSALVDRQRRNSLEGLAPRALRDRLEALEAEEPAVAEWPRRTARLERREGRPREALAAAQRTLALETGLEASCVAGWALARLDRCREALAGLEACAVEDADALLLRAGCHGEMQEWPEVIESLDGLPAEWQSRREVQRLRRQASAQIDVATEAVAEAVGVEESSDVMDGPVDLQEQAESAAVNPGAGEPASDSQAGPDQGRGTEPGTLDAELASIRSALQQASSVAELNGIYRRAADAASDHPDRPEAQFLAAEVAYRSSRWEAATRHFEAGGHPGANRPKLLFYLAVSLYESGRRDEARTALELCVDKLRPTEFVEAYKLRILGIGGSQR